MQETGITGKNNDPGSGPAQISAHSHYILTPPTFLIRRHPLRTWPVRVNPVNTKLISSPLLHLSFFPSICSSTLLGAGKTNQKLKPTCQQNIDKISPAMSIAQYNTPSATCLTSFYFLGSQAFFQLSAFKIVASYSVVM